MTMQSVKSAVIDAQPIGNGEISASSQAYFDVFWMLAAVMSTLAFAVPIMKLSVAENGARIGGE